MTKKYTAFIDTDRPFVSVVIAARNEEINIKECLISLLNQTYPKNKYEVWIGDDHSQDSTNPIIKSFIQSQQGFYLLEIKDRWKHLDGKANVLAQLIRKTAGEIILVTDADVEANPRWIESLVSHFDGTLSMISGATVVVGNTLFAQLQNAEWIFNIGNGHLQSEKADPVTAVGNNMAFIRKSYEMVGGYENIPFSITEDYELFVQIRAHGGTFKTLFQSDSLIFTRPIPDIKTLFEQRKRWMRGIFQLPPSLKFGLLFILNLLPLFIIAGILFGWKVFFIILILKWIADIFFLRYLYHKLDLKIDKGTLLYTPYSLLFNTLFLCYYFLPFKVNWKGRKY